MFDKDRGGVVSVEDRREMMAFELVKVCWKKEVPLSFECSSIAKKAVEQVNELIDALDATS